MHLLQFSQSIDSPSEIYVAFQWDPLLWPSLPPPQEGHGDTRVLCQMPSDSLRSTSTSKSHIHRHYRTISIDLIDIPHTKPESPALPALLLAVLVFLFLWSTAIVNLRSKYSEKNRSKEQLGTMKRGKTERKGEKKKTRVENKKTQLVHLCHWKPVKSPCVFVRVRVNKTVFEVGLQHCTEASLRPLLSPCKNVLGDYRKCYRIQS